MMSVRAAETANRRSHCGWRIGRMELPSTCRQDFFAGASPVVARGASEPRGGRYQDLQSVSSSAMRWVKPETVPGSPLAHARQHAAGRADPDQGPKSVSPIEKAAVFIAPLFGRTYAGCVH